jgi:hypothetical protein
MTEKSPATAEEVCLRLQGIGTEADAMMDRFSNGHVPHDQVEQVRERFKSLKERLESAYRRMDTLRGEAELSQAAELFYWPAIQDAWANSGISSVRWDSRPDNNWFDALYEVRFYMNYWAGNLRDSKEQK